MSTEDLEPNNKTSHDDNLYTQRRQLKAFIKWIDSEERNLRATLSTLLSSRRKLEDELSALEKVIEDREKSAAFVILVIGAPPLQDVHRGRGDVTLVGGLSTFSPKVTPNLDLGREKLKPLELFLNMVINRITDFVLFNSYLQRLEYTGAGGIVSVTSSKIDKSSHETCI